MPRRALWTPFEKPPFTTFFDDCFKNYEKLKTLATYLPEIIFYYLSPAKSPFHSTKIEII